MEPFEKKLSVLSKAGDSSSEHEDKCERCGAGCHATVDINGHHVVVEGLHCKYLVDTGTGEIKDQGKGRFHCSVYENRFDVAPWCGHTDYAAPRGWLRRGCPYAVAKGISSGKERLSPENYNNLWPHILREVLSMEWSDFVSIDKFMSEQLAKREGGTWEAKPGETEDTVVFERTDDPSQRTTD